MRPIPKEKSACHFTFTQMQITFYTMYILLSAAITWNVKPLYDATDII